MKDSAIRVQEWIIRFDGSIKRNIKSQNSNEESKKNKKLF
tara:strand:- start:2533 stop:2652 length:120 start_codon:yes stop_codon:yes gene_type:complete